MKLLRRMLLWTILFLGLVAAFDQLMIRVSMTSPALRPVQAFYVDFRQRLFALVTGAPSPGVTIEGVIGQDGQGKASGATGNRTGVEPPLRYLYVDKQGQLQFADSLQDIPREFRSQAKPLSP